MPETKSGGLSSENFDSRQGVQNSFPYRAVQSSDSDFAHPGLLIIYKQRRFFMALAALKNEGYTYED
ncbi:MAG: hypothetical protein R2941_22530, partial [Desulfobacterales bacterium]